MTDRIHSLTVVLEKDLRDDDCEELIQAIKMFRNVLSVTPHISDIATHMAEGRAKSDLQQKLWDIVRS